RAGSKAVLADGPGQLAGVSQYFVIQKMTRQGAEQSREAINRGTNRWPRFMARANRENWFWPSPRLEAEKNATKAVPLYFDKSLSRLIMALYEFL
ncbi:MAG: hypothetical protein AABZ14_07170, partial [Candidatus Margulisiibacteriota bacterium]